MLRTKGILLTLVVCMFTLLIFDIRTSMANQSGISSAEVASLFGTSNFGHVDYHPLDSNGQIKNQNFGIPTERFNTDKHWTQRNNFKGVETQSNPPDRLDNLIVERSSAGNQAEISNIGDPNEPEPLIIVAVFPELEYGAVLGNNEVVEGTRFRFLIQGYAFEDIEEEIRPKTLVRFNIIHQGNFVEDRLIPRQVILSSTPNEMYLRQYVTIDTIDDNVGEDDGSIELRLVGNFRYLIDSSYSSSLITIRDNDQSRIFIAPVYDRNLGYAVNEGDPATFVIGRSWIPGETPSRLTVNLSVEFTGLYFTDSIPQNVIIEAHETQRKFSIDTMGDDIAEPDGRVTVTILVGQDYKPLKGENSAEIEIFDDDTPVLSIAPFVPETKQHGFSVVEGETARYLIEGVNTPLDAGLSINYSVVRRGTFFGQIEPGDEILEWQSESKLFLLSIATESGERADIDGQITVTLEQGEGYNLANSPMNSSTIKVVDSTAKPTVFVTTRTGSGVEFIKGVGFVADRKVPITFTFGRDSRFAERLELEFVLESDFGSGIIAFTETIRIVFKPTDQNPLIVNHVVMPSRTNNPPDKMTATIIEKGHYRVSAPNKSVSVVTKGDDEDIVVSMTFDPSNNITQNFAVREGDGFLVNLTTPQPVNKNVTVNIQIDYRDFFLVGHNDICGPFRVGLEDTYQKCEMRVTILEGHRSAIFEVPTDDDVRNGLGGLMRISMKRGTGYSIASGSTSYWIKLRENDNFIPEIFMVATDYPVASGSCPEITENNREISMGDDINYAICMKGESVVNNELKINLNISQSQNFLMWHSHTVEIKPRAKSANFRLRTKYGIPNFEEVLIKVAISAPTVTELYEYYYTVDRNLSSATVMVRNNQQVVNYIDGERTSYSVASIILAQIVQSGDGNTSSSSYLETSNQTQIPPKGQQKPTVPSRTSQQLPIMSIATDAETMDEGSSVQFEITASFPLDVNLTVFVELSVTGGITKFLSPMTVNIPEGQRHAVLDVMIEDDKVRKPDSTLVAKIKMGANYIVSEDSIEGVTVTVLDATAKLLRQERIETLASVNQTVLPWIQSQTNRDTLRAVSTRMEAAFEQFEEAKISLNGQSTVPGILIRTGGLANDDSAKWQNFIDESSFTIPLTFDNGIADSAAIWGLGDNQTINQNEINGVSNNAGALTLGALGMDVVIGREFLSGAMATSAHSEVGIVDTNGEEMNFDLQSEGLQSYFGFNSLDGKLKLNTILGMETGELTIDQLDYEREEGKTFSHIFAISGRNQIYSATDVFGGSVSLENISKFVQTGNNLRGRSSLIPDMQIDSLRTGTKIVASQKVNFKDENLLSSALSTGIQNFRSGGISSSLLQFLGRSEFIYANNLSISGVANTTLSELDEQSGSGMLGTLDYDWNNDNLDLLVNFAARLGNNLEYSNAFEKELEFVNFGIGEIGSTQSANLDVEIGYGIPILKIDGIATPYLGMNLNGANYHQYKFGNRFSLGSKLNVTVEGKTTSIPNNMGSRSIGLTGNLNW